MGVALRSLAQAELLVFTLILVLSCSINHDIRYTWVSFGYPKLWMATKVLGEGKLGKSKESLQRVLEDGIL